MSEKVERTHTDWMNTDMRTPRRKRDGEYILITGAGFENQGAYLMLVSAATEVRDRFGKAPLVSYSTGSHSSKKRAGIKSLWPARVQGVVDALDEWVLGRIVLDLFPFVRDSRVVALLDASGFAFGDQWATADLAGRAAELERWALKGVPIYLLPQAFGPFELVGASAQCAASAARIVFARDRESHDHLVRVVHPQDLSKIRIAPDFTGTLHGAGGPMHLLEGKLVVVPNANIFLRAERAKYREAYLENLAGSVFAASELGIDTVGVCHAGSDDLRLLESVQDRVKDVPFPIVSELDGLEFKQALIGARVLVSGRFHATVSAFHLGVPTLVHGWSHKYRELCEEWNVPQLLVDPFAGTDSHRRALISILEDSAISPQLRQSSLAIQGLTEQMWREIADDYSGS